MNLIQVEWLDYLIGSLSVLPWAIVLLGLFPFKEYKRTILGVFLALALGWACTVLILWIHPLVWPEADFSPKKKANLLTQTAHLAFVQAGMVEEFFKVFFILLLSFALSFDFKRKIWLKETVLFAGFVALGFSWIENTHYIARELDLKKLDLFIARTIHSANIHLLINLCFGLFLIKANSLALLPEKLRLILFAFFLAVIQHGVVDFLLIPGSALGQWVSTALFIGIWVWVARDWRKHISPAPRHSPKLFS